MVKSIDDVHDFISHRDKIFEIINSNKDNKGNFSCTVKEIKNTYSLNPKFQNMLYRDSKLILELNINPSFKPFADEAKKFNFNSKN